jgi:hypothetical protein
MTDSRKTEISSLRKFLLISHSQVPTSFVQRGSEKHSGERFNVLQSTVKAVLIAIALAETDFPSNGLVAFRSGLRPRVVRKAIQTLTQNGWLVKTSGGHYRNEKTTHLDWNKIEANQLVYVPVPREDDS